MKQICNVHTSQDDYKSINFCWLGFTLFHFKFWLPSSGHSSSHHARNPAGYISISSIPALHHPATPPLAPSELMTPKRGVLCHPFANREIVFQPLKFEPERSMLQLVWGIPAQGMKSQEGVRSGSSLGLPAVCLGKDRRLWHHSLHWQTGFSLWLWPNKGNILRSPWLGTVCFKNWLVDNSNDFFGIHGG